MVSKCGQVGRSAVQVCTTGRSVTLTHTTIAAIKKKKGSYSSRENVNQFIALMSIPGHAKKELK